MSVRAAITSILRIDSLSRILKSCIAWGGDTDTVATIALAAASCGKEFEKDIPDGLLKGFEKGAFGMFFIKGLDKKLMKLATKAKNGSVYNQRQFRTHQ